MHTFIRRTAASLILCVFFGIQCDECFAADPTPEADRGQFFSETVLPILKTYCGNCHEDGSEHDLPFADAASIEQLFERRTLWRNVAAQLRNRTMPPVDESQPSEDERIQVSQWIDDTLRESACDGEAYAGTVTTRRLNRREYANTIRDLFGVELDFATTLPVDSGGGEGFDNNGETLFLPPLLLERYLEAAQQIVDAVVVPPPMSVLFQPREMFPQDAALEKSRVIRAGEKVDVLIPIPVAGNYLIIAGMVPLDEGELTVTVEVDDLTASKLTFRRYGPKGEANQEQCELRLTRGLHKIGIRANDRHDAEIVRIRITRVDQPTTPVQIASHMRLLGVKPAHVPADPKSVARRTIRRIGTRAFRRPMSDAEIDQYISLYERAKQRGDSYEESLKLAMKAILISPNFLFRIEGAPRDEEIEPISNHELATRLSYFLWSTTPDDQLSALADQRLLQSDAVLEHQINRMLDDPRSQEFFDTFVGQWLGTRDVGGRRAATENSIQNFYTPFIAADMRKQAVLLVEHVIREDRSILELLDADYTFVTGKLAKFYGMAGASDLPRDSFTRVELDNRRRGGLLGLGGFLALTSHISERETSPVLRGAWVLDTLLGTKIPSPPDDVPPLDRSKREGNKLTLRQTLELHRENKACAACHNLMDPIGFALENFDFLGRWREADDGKPIDAVGKMPSGEIFDGPDELKQVLLKSRDQFSRQLIRKLLGYALGRSLVDADECTIERLMRELESNEYRGRALLKSVVLSTPFRNRSHPKDDER